MVGPFLWLFLNGIGVCTENSFVPTSHLPEDFVNYKWWMPSKDHESEDLRKRQKRLIVPRQDVLVFPDLTKAFEEPTPTPQGFQKPRRKGNRNSKKKGGAVVGKEDASKVQKAATGTTDKKLKKQVKINKKTNTEFFRQGQSPRRLRQHMQHKKKVKQFLQKRIQEQIEQRSQNPAIYT